MKRLHNSKFHIQNSTLLITALLTLLLTSCDTVLQYPEEPGIDPDHPEEHIQLHVTCDFNFRYTNEMEYDYLDLSGIAPKGTRTVDRHQMRFIAKAYSADDRSIKPQAVRSWTFYAPEKSDVDMTFDIDLPAGDYRIVMWCDYVDADIPTDFYYSTLDFSEIILKNESGHYGSDSYRDAFYGETRLTVDKKSGNLCADILLTRPFARYSFVSTDLEEFVNSENVRRNKADVSAGASDLSDYTVRVVYTQYMPCVFNAHTGKPIDSRTGVEYHSLISLLDDAQALLAYDFVFTNGSSTSIAVAMEVLHSDGSVVASVPPIDIPIMRNQHTVLYGKFLTTKSGGGIGVNPGFGGSFNIEIK